MRMKYKLKSNNTDYQQSREESKIDIADFEFEIIGYNQTDKMIQVKHKISGKIFAMKIIDKQSTGNKIKILNHPFIMNVKHKWKQIRNCII